MNRNNEALLMAKLDQRPLDDWGNFTDKVKYKRSSFR
jgi:hypothetical protein